MKIKGKILKVLPLTTGSGKFGHWKRRDIIVEQGNKYQSKLCLCIWKKELHQIDFIENIEAEFEVELESKTYNGAWFTQIVVKSVSLPSSNPKNNYFQEVEHEDAEDYNYTKSELRDMYEAAFENDPQWEWNID